MLTFWLIVSFIEVVIDGLWFVAIDGRTREFPCLNRAWWIFTAYLLIQSFLVINYYNLWC